MHKFKSLFLLFIPVMLVSFNTYAEYATGPFVEADYYDGLGTKMRHEKIYTLKDGVKQVIQDRIYVDSTNELREEWILDSNGKRIYIRPDDGSIYLDDKEYPSGSPQAEDAKQIAVKRYKAAKSGSKPQPQPAKAVSVGADADTEKPQAPSDLAWDPLEYSNRKLVANSDCYYRQDKKEEGQTSAMRLVFLKSGTCGSADTTVCVGKVYCFQKDSGIPFSLAVACPAVGPETCPDPKSCVLAKNVQISPGYGHYGSGSKAKAPATGAAAQRAQ